MFNGLGRLATAHPWGVCAAWLVAAIGLSLVAPSWDSKAQDDDIHFLPARCASVRGYQLLSEAFPQDIFASRAIFAVERADGPLTAADFALVDQLVDDLDRLRRQEPALQISNLCSYRDGFIGSRLTSTDKRCTLIQVGLGTPFLALQTRATVDRTEAVLRARLAERGPEAPRLLATGPASLGRDLLRASADSLDGTALATVVLVVVILLLVYRAPLLALVPLATIALSVWVSLKLLALTTLLPGVHLVNISKVFAIVILYGAGTDYCLFLISRYREELTNGATGARAVRRSVSSVGCALAASAGTVICGLGLMGLAEFAKVRCAGPAIALSLAVALLASLTLAPALLRLLGRTVFWPTYGPQPRTTAAPPRAGFWDWVSRGVVARPVLVWGVAMLLLAPLACLGLHASPNYKSTGELPPGAESIQGVKAIQRHFTAGEVGPLTVLLTSATSWDSPAGRAVVAHLSRAFAHLDNVAEVRSLTQPLGTEDGPLTPATLRAPSAPLLQLFQREIDGLVQQANRKIREFYVTHVPGDGKPRSVTRLDVVFRSDPFDAASTSTYEVIQTWLREELPGVSGRLGDVGSECYGVTVNARDLAHITEQDRRRVNVLVLGGIFVILLLLVRRVWLAAYLLGTVLFSYLATLGATVLIGTLWSGRPLGEVEWRVPFFLFTILVAVGEDYNILLITRVLQERSRRGTQEGIRQALARTGGTITSCGLIMAGTFATLMLAGLGTLVQIGFALAFGVLLDTLIVRPVLVPAFTLVVWRQRRPKVAVPDIPPEVAPARPQAA